MSLTEATDEALRLLAAGGNRRARAELKRREPPRRGRGRPRLGTVREFVIPDDLYDHLRAEARRQSIPIAAMLRRILTERYEGKK